MANMVEVEIFQHCKDEGAATSPERMKKDA